MLIAAEVLTCIGVLISFNYGFVTYSVAQYMTGALILFVSAEVLEGTHSSFCRSIGVDESNMYIRSCVALVLKLYDCAFYGLIDKSLDMLSVQNAIIYSTFVILL